MLFPVSCGTPPLVPHASLVLSKEATTFVATYTCDSGYDLPDAQNNKKQCVENTDAWSTDTVVCNIKGDIILQNIAHLFLKSTISKTLC